MPRYLVAIYRPDDYDGSTESAEMGRDIDDLNEAMVARGIRVFVGGLRSEREARAIRGAPDRPPMVTDGPYADTKEHIGGFWVLEVASLEEALDWGSKAAVACRAGVEVRPFN